MENKQEQLKKLENDMKEKYQEYAELERQHDLLSKQIIAEANQEASQENFINN